MASKSMTPRMSRRQGSAAPGAVTRCDSMNQGSFQTRGGAIPTSPAESMGQGSGARPGKIGPTKVPRVANSMHQ